MPGQKRANSSTQQSRPPTEFEQRLYAACKRIPCGKVATYGQLAQILNSAPRAVGQALRRNPYAPVVPCHRVIAASLELGGFSGSWVCLIELLFFSLEVYIVITYPVLSSCTISLVQTCPQGPNTPNGCKKLKLLQEEGVLFVNGKLASRTMLATLGELQEEGGVGGEGKLGNDRSVETGAAGVERTQNKRRKKGV